MGEEAAPNGNIGICGGAERGRWSSCSRIGSPLRSFLSGLRTISPRTWCFQTFSSPCGGECDTSIYGAAGGSRGLRRKSLKEIAARIPPGKVSGIHLFNTFPSRHPPCAGAVSFGTYACVASQNSSAEKRGAFSERYSQSIFRTAVRGGLKQSI